MKTFFQELEQLLDRFDMRSGERDDIIADYKQMFQDGLDKGLEEAEIIEKIGTPDKIYESLKSEYNVKKKIPKGEKLIAISPFVATVIFFIMGFMYELWHPGWMVFLLIPITAITVEMINDEDKHLTTALSPFVATITFILVGTFTGLWHPMWLVFLLIPIMAIINDNRAGKTDKITSMLTALSPFVSVIIFVLIGYYTNVYTPTWLILLLPIPLALISGKEKPYRGLTLLAFFVSITLYLVLGYAVTNWTLALSAFLIFIIVGILTEHINIVIEGVDKMVLKIGLILSLIAFLIVGYFTGAWSVAWLILLIPIVIAIVSHPDESHKLTGISPFFALAGFILLGTFFNAWHIAWLIFMIIPVIAILEEKNDD